jgi:two-component system, response regulator YesN
MHSPLKSRLPLRFGLFFHFLLKHLAVLAIIAAIGIPVYAIVISDVRKNEIRNRSEKLDVFKNQLENELREIDELMFNVTWSSEMNRVLAVDTVDFGSRDLHKTIALNNYLAEKLDSNSFAHDIAVFCQSSQVLVSARWIVLRMPFYYGSLFKLDGIDYHSWRTQYLENTSLNTHVSSAHAVDRSEELPIILYARSITLGENRKATILVMLDIRRIHRLFEEANITLGGRYEIISKSGAVLSSSNFKDLQGDKESSRRDSSEYQTDDVMLQDVVTLETVMKGKGWLVRADVPQKEILASFWSGGAGISIALVGALFFGLISSVFFALQASNPIRRVMFKVHALVGDNTKEGKGGIALVEREVSALLEHDRVIGRRLQEQRMAVKAVYIDRLLKGQVDGDEIQGISAMVGVDLQMGRIVVAVLSLNRDPEYFPVRTNSSWEGLAIVVRDKAMAHMRSVADAQAVSRNSIALFMRVKDGDDQAAYETAHSELRNLVEEITQELRVNVIAGVGVIAASPYDIWRSYQTATKAIEEGGTTSYDNLVQSASVMEPSSGYYYPLELELEITKLSKAGANEEVGTALQAVIQENKNRNLELADELALVNEIRATIHKLSAPLSIDRGLVQVPEPSGQPLDWNTFENGLNQVFHEICSAVNCKKNSHNRALADRIKHFINENYSDPQLSLALVALEFSLSESYVSHFFVEQTGEQYSRYVEIVRMTSARALLESSGSRIEDIAYAVGYTSVHGFRRAFKRVVGRAPLDYRKYARVSGSSTDSGGPKPASF